MLVLVVSSYLLFQNVYTTFKALKPPKPSRKSKNGVDPSVKAKQARKRELKGMLACWIVWSCWSSAEAVADRTISVVTPFYNEIKMFLVLFLILGRATMAEAILLHVIRPLVKPYYVSLDWFIQIFTSAADLGVLLVKAPLESLKLISQRAWAVLQKTFSSGALPRPGGHAVSASDPDEPLNEPANPEATSTKEKAEPDPLERFKPKTRGYAQQESEPEDIVYKNPLRDDPPPYGVPREMIGSVERDYPPVFSSRRAPSRSRPDGLPYGRRMSIDQRPAYMGDSSSVTSVSYRGESEVGGPTYGFPSGGEGITNGAGDLAPDTNPDVPSFALSSPEHPPVSVPAAPAVPSYLQPRTRASRANLNPNRQRKDSYIDGRNPRASAFLEGERGMTFADKPKEAKGLTPDVGGYASPTPMGYGSPSPPTAPSPPAYGNPYAARGRSGYPTRPFSPADDESDSGSRVDVIQGWRQRSAIPPEPSKQRRAPSAGPGGSSYPYQAASVPYSPQSPPSVAPSFPTPSIAPSLTPSQSVSNVFARPQPGYRPPSTGPENRPPTAVSRPPTTAPSHPPTSTTGMGLPRRQRSTRELRSQIWDPKEDNSAALAEQAKEAERREIERKEAERVAALERQRRKVSERTVRGKKDTRDEVISGEGF